MIFVVLGCAGGTRVGKRQRYLIVLAACGVAAYLIDRYQFGPHISGQVDIRGALTIDLPSGSRHRIEQGIDSSVGTITLGGNGYRLDYDIGHLAGNYAINEANGPFAWQKQEVNGGTEMLYSLGGEDARQTLFVSFPDLGPANFWTDIRNPSDVDAILEVMRTVRPVLQ